jgi:hypothetical protein
VGRVALDITERVGAFVLAENAAKRSATERAGAILVCERVGLGEAPASSADHLGYASSCRLMWRLPWMQIRPSRLVLPAS